MPYIDEALLDDPEELQRKDSRDTLRALASAGAQVREAMTLADEAGIDRLASTERPRSVLVAAIGGSSIVADVLELLAEPGSPVPVQARRNLPLPGWVGPLDLVVAVSLSGRAPGPLAVAAEAARRGAMLLTVGADDSPLAQVCRSARGVHVGVGSGGRTSSRTRCGRCSPRCSSVPTGWACWTPRPTWCGLSPSGWTTVPSSSAVLRRLRQPRQDPRRPARRDGAGRARGRAARRGRRGARRLDAGPDRPHPGDLR